MNSYRGKNIQVFFCHLRWWKTAEPVLLVRGTRSVMPLAAQGHQHLSRSPRLPEQGHMGITVPFDFPRFFPSCLSGGLTSPLPLYRNCILLEAILFNFTFILQNGKLLPRRGDAWPLTGVGYSGRESPLLLSELSQLWQHVTVVYLGFY